MRGYSICGAVVALLCVSANARAYSFQNYSVMVSVEGGTRANALRLNTGTRKTPATAAEGGVSAELMVYAPKDWPHRWSIVASLWPDVEGTWSIPTQGRRPGLATPLLDPGILKDLA